MKISEKELTKCCLLKKGSKKIEFDPKCCIKSALFLKFKSAMFGNSKCKN